MTTIKDILTPYNFGIGLCVSVVTTFFGLIIWYLICDTKEFIGIILGILSIVVLALTITAIGAFTNWVIKKTKGEA